MKLAICQFHTQWEQQDRNFRKAEEWISQAASQNAQMIFFPELSFIGFTMNLKMAEGEHPQTLEFLKEMSRKYQIAIGAGYSSLYGQKAQNRYAIVNSMGEIVLDYAKIHPFSFAKEDLYYEGGVTLPTGEILGMPVGVQICYDLRFPEMFRLLADRAHLVIVPANWPEKRREQWLALLRARAIENQYYVLGVNCYGQIGNLFYTGDSCLMSPLGEMRIAPSQEGNFYLEMEDDVLHKRDHFPVLKDRKQDLYRKLEESYGKV